MPKLSPDENAESLHRLDSEPIKKATINELKSLIHKDISNKRATGYDLITGSAIKKLIENGVLKLLYLTNACLRHRHVPTQCKVAEISICPSVCLVTFAEMECNHILKTN